MDTAKFTHLEVGEASLETRFIPGRSDVPTLVLLHEGLGCVALWRDFPAQLAARTGCPVLAWSRQGYGNSSPRELPWPLDYMQQEGAALSRVLDAAGVGDCILIGHSDGASIALVAAGSVGAARIRGLVVMAPHVFTESGGLESIRAAKQAYEQGDLRQRLQKYHGANVDCAFRGWAESWLHPDFVDWNIESFLAGIRVPVLQIQGRDDQYGTVAQLQAIARQASTTVTTHVLEDCKHAPQFEQPEQTLALIAAFVADLAP